MTDKELIQQAYRECGTKTRTSRRRSRQTLLEHCLIASADAAGTIAKFLDENK